VTNARSNGTGGAAAREMPLIHRIFRSQLAEAQALVPVATAHDATRVDAVAGHLKFLLDGLHMHHTTEDEHIWPKLLDRVGPDEAEVRRMAEQHEQVHVSMNEVREATASWVATPTEASAAELTGRIGSLLEVVEQHLDEEEREVVPLIDQHLSAAEWQEVGERGFEKFTPAQRWIALGQLLEVATPEEAAMMMRSLPLPVKVLWPLFGKRSYRRYIAPVRGGPGASGRGR